MLSCHNLKKSFGIISVLKDISFDIKENEKVAIVGRNGQGKTTIFKLITGELLKDDGMINYPKGAKLGYMSQMPPLTPSNTIYEELLGVFSHILQMEKDIEELSVKMATGDETIMKNYDKLMQEYDACGGYIYKSRIRGVIKGLGFGCESHYISSLSGGQKTKLSMAKLFLTGPDILLLDEPTNHLDLESVIWLEGFLKDYRGTVIFISHDRYFINKVSTKIIEIENGRSTTYLGDYNFYLAKKQENYENELKNFADQQKVIKAQEESIRLLKSFNREKSVKRAESKEKMLEKMDKLDSPQRGPNKIRLELEVKIKSGNDVLKVENLSKKFGDRQLFKNVSFEIKRGEKIALIGPVGIGKTTLLKMLLDENIKKGVNVEIAYYEQNLEYSIDPNNTILEEVHNAYPRLNVIDIRNVLAAFVFYGDDVNKKIKGLSGGEKARVNLAKIMLTGANFLILDEPTNHLDIASKDVLEEALLSYRGTLLYISHDRFFINKTADKIIELSPSGVEIFLGNYDYYAEKKKEMKPFGVLDVKEEKSISANKENFYDKKAKEASERKIKGQINRLEKAIDEHESKIKALEEELLKDEITTDHVKSLEIFRQKEEAEKALAQLYNEWESLQEVSVD